jgi:hypothetical protein
VSGNGMLVGISATAWATPADSRTASGSQPASAAAAASALAGPGRPVRPAAGSSSDLPEGRVTSLLKWRPAWPPFLAFLREPSRSSVTTRPRSSVWDHGWYFHCLHSEDRCGACTPCPGQFGSVGSPCAWRSEAPGRRVVDQDQPERSPPPSPRVLPSGHHPNQRSCNACGGC